MAVLVTTSREVAARDRRALSVKLATSAEAIEIARRLRYRALGGELGARMRRIACSRERR